MSSRCLGAMGALLAQQHRLVRARQSRQPRRGVTTAPATAHAGGADAPRGGPTYLKELRIRNFALVEEQVVHFAPGLNVITGASGSGKSVLMDAIAQLCGAPMLDEHVRPPADSATLEAVFYIGPEHAAAVEALVKDTPPAQPNTLVLHRLLNEPPRSVCKVNGRAVPLRVLRALGNVLVDVNGQGAAQQLGDSAACVVLLDARAGTAQLAAQFGASLVWARTAEGEAARARAAAPSSQEEADAMQALVDDVVEAEAEPGEDAAIKRQLKRLDASRAALDSCALASQALDVGASDALRTAARELKSVALRLEQHSDSGAATVTGRPSDDGGDGDEDEAVDVASALASVDQALGLVRTATDTAANASAACSDAARALQTSPGLRDELSARLRVLERLCRKHSARSVDDLLEAASTARDALGNTDGAAEKAAAMADAAAAAVRDMARLGLQLGLARREAARQLQGHVEQALGQLCMEGARLRVALEWHDIAVTEGDDDDDEGGGSSSSHAVSVPGADALGFDTQCLYEPTPSGFDRASLLLATGPGEPFRPLSAVASGGERARVMLALKAVAAAAAGPAVSLFDEVDAGVGGSAGGAVGAALRRLSQGGASEGALQRQVLCVTHLPQVAAHAHVHLAVSKVPAPDGRAVSVTAELHSRQARAAELGTLLGLTSDAGEQLLAMTEAQARREPAPLT